MTTRLYALGSNSAGQLGLGHYKDVDIPSPCLFLRSTDRSGSQQGGSSNVKDLSDMLWGIQPTYELNSNIRKVVAGGTHTLVLCNDGAVYAAGHPEALGETVDLQSSNTAMDGASPADFTPYFKRVSWWDADESIDTFTDISATWSASFFVVSPQIQGGHLTRSGRVYGCGIGERGELGLGKDVVEVKRPRCVAVFGSKGDAGSVGYDAKGAPVLRGILGGIWSGVAHTVACDTAHVLGWGACRKGQLGSGMRDEKVAWNPTEVFYHDSKQGVRMDCTIAAAVGRDLTLLRGRDNGKESEIAQWRLMGANSFVQSVSEEAREFLAAFTVPVPRDDDMLLQTSPLASWSNLYVLDNVTHIVKGLGRNDRGQLPPDQLPRLRAMAAGSEHCVGWTLEGEIVTWGWGEHGNCGRPCDATGRGWSVLRIAKGAKERVHGVGAGCATTFTWTLEI